MVDFMSLDPSFEPAPSRRLTASKRFDSATSGCSHAGRCLRPTLTMTLLRAQPLSFGANAKRGWALRPGRPQATVSEVSCAPPARSSPGACPTAALLGNAAVDYAIAAPSLRRGVRPGAKSWAVERCAINAALAE